MVYGITAAGVPQICGGCSQPNSINHALNCLTGTFDIRKYLGASFPSFHGHN